jgi:hypothetical protein
MINPTGEIMCATDIQGCASSSLVSMMPVAAEVPARDGHAWILGGLIAICALIVIMGIRRSARQAHIVDAMTPDEQADYVSKDSW